MGAAEGCENGDQRGERRERALEIDRETRGVQASGRGTKPEREIEGKIALDERERLQRELHFT